jgi:uncharacterized protein (TIGR01244 family)
MFRLLLLSLMLSLIPLAGHAATPAEAALAGLPHVSFPAPHRVASGRLQAGDVAALKRAGIEQVIDLSVDSETPGFDEAAAMREAGIGYHNLPIHGAGDLTRDRVRQFDRLLRDAGAQPTLVHCASSNRVGAMIALRAALIDGKSTETALAEGRRWGLKSLEPAVRERLQTWSGSPQQGKPEHPAPRSPASGGGTR